MFKEKRIISHRGIHDNQTIFENSKEAISLAVSKKYIIEIDIRLTKDNKIVVFHDENTKRITKKDLIVENSSYKEINNQNIINIPQLEEILNIIKGSVPLLIEIKPHKKIGVLEQKLINILKNYKGKYAIQSFDPIILYWFKKNYPNIIRGQLSCKYKNKKIPIYQKFILSNMLLNPLTKPNFISYKYNELSLKKINKYKKKKIKLLAWTIKTKEDYDKYIDLYDYLICEKFI